MNKFYSRSIIGFFIAAFSLFFLTLNIAFSQAPDKINYQAVARNAGGNPIVSTNIGVKFTIHQNLATGPNVYTETHAVTTNAFGLFSAMIGQGTPVSGSFNSISWATDSYWLEVFIDPTPPSAYVTMGTTQFVSVPYAKQASSAEAVTGLVDIPNGGTNISNYASGDLLYATSPLTLARLPIGADGDVLTVSGSLPTWGAVSAGGPWTGSGTVITNNAPYTFVGIGLPAPTYPLHIYDGNPEVMLQSSGGAFKAGYSIKTATKEWFFGQEVGASQNLRIKDVTAGVVRFAIDPVGNVGIGTQTPGSLFHVYNNAASSATEMRVEYDSNVGSSEINLKTNNGGATIYNQLEIYKGAPGASGTIDGISLGNLSAVSAGAEAGPLMLRTVTNNPMYFLTSNTQKMILDGSGKLGIGLPNPSAKLHVYSTSSHPRIKLETAVGLTGGPYLALKHGEAGGREWIIGSSGSANSAGVGKFNIYDATLGQDRMVIDGNGNMGIGTVSPSVNSRLAINDGHIQSLQSTLPGITFSAPLTGASLVGGSTDVKGNISAAGTINGGLSATVTVTFNKTYTTVPVVVVTATNQSAARMDISVVASNTNFIVTIANNTGAGFAGPSLNYIVIE